MVAAEEQIERIVREVMRRLQAGATGGNVAAQQEKSGSAINSELRLGLPVISVDRLEGKLNGIKQIVVSPKAVVTPAAKDLLKERGVKLIRGEVANHHSTNYKLTLAVGVAETPSDPNALCRELKNAGVTLEELARTGLSSVTEELSEQVARGGRIGLLLTGNVTAAVCLANRSRGVRAAEARCAASTREAVRGVGVNLLVVNPLGKSTFELKRMVEVLLAGGGVCPAQWRGKLDS